MATTGCRMVLRRYLFNSTEKSSSGVEGFVNLLKQVEKDKGKVVTQQQEKHHAEPTAMKSFGDLLRSSQLMHLGGIEGRTIVGVISNTIGDDLYINFGGKFQCVCRRPTVRKSAFRAGAKVRLRLNDLEMTSYFMGATKDLTLLEADAVLLGVADDPFNSLHQDVKQRPKRLSQNLTKDEVL